MVISHQCSPLLYNKILDFQLFNSFPNDKFYSPKLKEFAMDNFGCDKNGRKRVENTVEKGDMARYEQRRKTLKIFFSETRRCRALIFGM